MRDFEDFLCVRNDEIDNAAYDLAVALIRDNEIEWDMAYIGEIVDAAIELLWSLIADEPFDGESETFESRFYGIGEDDDPEPISRMDVWHWFDEKHSKGVHYLLYDE